MFGVGLLSAQKQNFEIGGVLSEGLASAYTEDGKYGFVNEKGKVVIPFKYSFVWNFRGGLAAVQLDDLFGFIDKTGKTVIPHKYSLVVSPFNEKNNFAIVGLDGKMTIIDRKGKELIPLKYDFINVFYEEMAGVKIGEKWGFIDSNFNEVIPVQYDDSEGFFNNGVAKVTLKKKSFYIDKTGKCVKNCPKNLK